MLEPLSFLRARINLFLASYDVNFTIIGRSLPSLRFGPSLWALSMSFGVILVSSFVSAMSMMSWLQLSLFSSFTPEKREQFLLKYCSNSFIWWWVLIISLFSYFCKHRFSSNFVPRSSIFPFMLSGFFVRDSILESSAFSIQHSSRLRNSWLRITCWITWDTNSASFNWPLVVIVGWSWPEQGF